MSIYRQHKISRELVEAKNVEVQVMALHLDLYNIRSKDICELGRHVPINLTFDGYDKDSRELNEIPEVVSFAKEIVRTIPIMMYLSDYSVWVILNLVKTKVISKTKAGLKLQRDFGNDVQIDKFLNDFFNLQNRHVEHYHISEQDNEEYSKKFTKILLMNNPPAEFDVV